MQFWIAYFKLHSIFVITVKIRNQVDLAAIVRERRRELGLTQAQLAAKISASRLWVGNLEKGKVPVTVDLLFRAFKILRLEMDVGFAVQHHPEIDLDQIIENHRK